MPNIVDHNLQPATTTTTTTAAALLPCLSHAAIIVQGFKKVCNHFLHIVG
jgi:hypothetical protein